MSCVLFFGARGITMTSQDLRADIARLEAVRRQTQIWRAGISVALLVTTVGSLAMIRNSVYGLFQPGDIQNQFTTKLSSNLQKDVVPQVQALATQTLTQMRPEVETAFNGLNKRTPELSQAASTQFDTLQKNVQEKGQAAIEKTFGDMLAKKEVDLKKQFPDASDEKLKAIAKNVSDEAAERIVSSRDTLFSKHLAALNSSMGHLSDIQESEKVPADEQVADWDLVSAVLDMAHHDANNLGAPSLTTSAGGATTSASASTSTTKPAPAKDKSNESTGY